MAEPTIIFMGSPDVAVPSLGALDEAFGVDLVVTKPDRPVGRGRHQAAPPVKDAAVELGLEVFQPETKCSDAILRRLAEAGPDFLVVLAYGEILSQRVLDLPKIAPVNAHFSLLPKHRGPSPVNAAIVEGDDVSGVSTMRMVRRMDAGPVYMQQEVRLAEDETAGSLGDKLAPIAARLLVETIRGLCDGTLDASAQNEAEATYCGLLSKRDGRIDWADDACGIERKVRGFDPWPGVFTYFGAEGEEKRMLKVIAAECIDRDAGASPGRVMRAEGEIAVACGEGELLIRELQPAGKRRMSAEEFLNGHDIGEGEVLG